MAGDSKIEWTDSTWNPIVGCSIVSPGCTNCYAMRTAARMNANPATPHYHGTVESSKAGPVWTGKVAQAPDAVLLAPLHWKKPRRIFVNSMGDLFHKSIPDEWIDKVFAVMALSQQHTFQILTKRAERMRDYINGRTTAARRLSMIAYMNAMDHAYGLRMWPLPNVWLGISAERQQEADERIPHLLQTPAAIRFVSAEPLLGAISFRWAKWDNWCHPDNRGRSIVDEYDGLRMIDWIIVGGESGPRARPMHPQWARDIRDQCAAAGVAFFFKQWGEWLPGHHYTDELQQRDSNQHYSRYACMDWDGDRAVESDGLAGWDELDDHAMWRVGKKSAGRLLDGKEHNAFPNPRQSSFEATTPGSSERGRAVAALTTEGDA